MTGALLLLACVLYARHVGKRLHTAPRRKLFAAGKLPRRRPMRDAYTRRGYRTTVQDSGFPPPDASVWPAVLGAIQGHFNGSE